MTKPTDRIVFVTANGINKTLKQAIVDGDLSGGGGGSGIIEVVNSTIVLASVPTIPSTGFLFFKAPQAMVIDKVILQIFTKGGISSGNLIVDIKKNSTPNPVGMTSIFTTLPTIDYATAIDYQTNSGVLNVANTSLLAEDWLRVDLTSIPSNLLDKFFLLVYGA